MFGAEGLQVRKRFIGLLAGTSVFAGAPAHSADALKFGPPPSWVHQQAIPAAKPTSAPVSLLLNDQQIALERGKMTTYSEGALKIENSQGLDAGNLSLVWQPATDTVTVNKLQIRRGDKIIDVLASGQTFTILRRETNLDAATLDGTLTATIQPEGLQEGDIIDFATTVERSDPVLKGHVEAMFGAWGGMPIQAAHAALSWPADLRLQLRQTPNLPAAQKSSTGGKDSLELSAHDVEPLVPPNGAPQRFKIGRLAEATDFGSWSDLANLFIPLFKNASVIPASGPLHDEVVKIRASTPDPKLRAQQALQLVQDRVRYVALLMGQGGYVPASAEQTWSRRFGDCKAKTALLLGILHSLGIEAEPVLVQSRLGDMIADRLPMIGLFDHVLVRAHLGGKEYWLDGTRMGDTDLDSIEVPDFGWGLPLIDHSQLVRMVPAPLKTPNREDRVAVDASAGIFAPASVTVEELYRGDSAVAFNALYSVMAADQRDQAFRDEAKQYFDSFTVDSSSLQFDKAKRELTITIKGAAKLNWKDGWALVPTSSIGFNPDFDRAAGPLHEVPLSVNYPRYIKDSASIRLPAGFAAQQKLSPAVRETLAGVEYARTETVAGDVLTVDSSERSLVPEIAYKDALVAEPQLRALDKDDVYLKVPSEWHPSDGDVAALKQTTPTSSADFFIRAAADLAHADSKSAIADATSGLALDPKNMAGLGIRANAYLATHEYAAAEKDVAEGESIDPENPGLLFTEALLAQAKGDSATACKDFSKVLAKRPDNNFALGRRAVCEHDAGKDEQALADSAVALKAVPTSMDLRVLRANILLVEGKKDLVADEARLLMEQNPKANYAFVAAGRIYARIGRPVDAMKAFDRALAIKPEAYVYLNRAQSRPFTDKAGRMADLDAALKLEPANSDALAEKAEELVSDGDYKGALQFYDQVVKAEADNSYYKLRRAVVMFKAGNVSEAKKLIAEQDSDAKSAGDFNNLCWEKATAGILLDGALEDCHQALKRQPQTGGYIDSLAFVELRLGRIDDAIADYDRAIANKSGAASYMGRAIAYARKGDKVHADADRAQALKLDPNEQTRFEEFGLELDEGSTATASHQLQSGKAPN